jgi:hypothetical protein
MLPSMSDLLAIFGSSDADADVLAEIAHLHPDRVTVLVEDNEADLVGEKSEEGDALRTRLAGLMTAIERDTGATVVGLAGDRSQLRGWRFDRAVAPQLPLAA